MRVWSPTARRWSVAASGQPVIDEATHQGLVAYLSDPARRPAVSFEKRHMLSGVARCGKCDQVMYATYPDGKNAAWCTPAARHHTSPGSARLLDEYVEALVLAWFSQPKTRKRLAALLNGGRDVDVKALQAQRDGLQARMDKLARMHIAGDIDDSQLRSGTTEHRAQRDAIDKILAKASRRSPAAGMLAADDPRAYWAACSPDIRGKIVDEIMTATCAARAARTVVHRPRQPHTAEWERFGDYLDVAPKV